MDNINVLIVEDTPAESEALVKVITENNYNVVGVARTHQEALTLFYQNIIDIVIIDVFLDCFIISKLSITVLNNYFEALISTVDLNKHFEVWTCFFPGHQRPLNT